MFFASNKKMRLWFLSHFCLVFSHFCVIWTLYLFTYSYKKADFELNTLIWAIIASVVVLIYLLKVLFIMIRFYKWWNRPFLTVSDYEQWYFLNKYLVFITIIPLLVTAFFALRKLPINSWTNTFSNYDYLIYLVFILILIFNVIIIWYNYKYKKHIKLN